MWSACGAILLWKCRGWKNRSSWKLWKKVLTSETCFWYVQKLESVCNWLWIETRSIMTCGWTNSVLEAAVEHFSVVLSCHDRVDPKNRFSSLKSIQELRNCFYNASIFLVTGIRILLVKWAARSQCSTWAAVEEDSIAKKIIPQGLKKRCVPDVVDVFDFYAWQNRKWKALWKRLLYTCLVI